MASLWDHTVIFRARLLYHAMTASPGAVSVLFPLDVVLTLLLHYPSRRRMTSEFRRIEIFGLPGAMLRRMPMKFR